jgi:serine/threonine protein kinase
LEPKRILDPKFEYTMFSDIYSFGVLMWEISSGEPPFKASISHNDITALSQAINNGLREDSIPETPEKYVKLYKACWDQEPKKRPMINQVFSRLETMLDIQNKKSLELSSLSNLITGYKLFNIINIDELSDIRYNSGDDFSIFSKAMWKKTNDFVICKGFRNTELISNNPIEAFIHELDMHRRMDFCSRIIRILGISFGNLILNIFIICTMMNETNLTF